MGGPVYGNLRLVFFLTRMTMNPPAVPEDSRGLSQRLYSQEPKEEEKKRRSRRIREDKGQDKGG